MKKKLLLIIIIIFISCSLDDLSHEYYQFNFQVEAEQKFPLENTQNKININLEEFTSLKPADYKFVFTLENSENVIIKNEKGNILKPNELYSIVPGITTLEYLNPKAGLNKMSVSIINLTYSKIPVEVEKTKILYLNNIAPNTNFSAYIESWDVQNTASVYVNIIPQNGGSLKDYNLTVIINKKPDVKYKYEPYVLYNESGIDNINEKYYDGAQIPLNNNASIILANTHTRNQIKSIQFKLNNNLLSDELDVRNP